MKDYTSKPGKSQPFTLDGVKFHTSGSISLLDLVDVARLAQVDVTDPRGISALGDFFESALGNVATYAVHEFTGGGDASNMAGAWKPTGEQVKLDADEPSTQERVVSGELVLWQAGEYDRFRKHVRRHGTDPATLLDIMTDLIQEVGGGTPTMRPSPSVDGPPTTGATYTVVSSSGEVTHEPLTEERAAQLREAVARANGS